MCLMENVQILLHLPYNNGKLFHETDWTKHYFTEPQTNEPQLFLSAQV